MLRPLSIRKALNTSPFASPILIGVQQHFTVPASEFPKDAFTDGMPFDGSSVEGFQAINELT